MPAPLILHAGMHKTGTSSIQQSLYSGLKDPRFHYVGCGLVNGSRPIHTLVADHPQQHHAHRDHGLAAGAVERLRNEYERQWQQQLVAARSAGAIPILSAEECWVLSELELQRLNHRIQVAGFEARVVVYLRSPLAWMSSMVQELLKTSLFNLVDPLLQGAEEQIMASPYLRCDYLQQLARLEAVFGASNLTVRLFRSDCLLRGCVVTDFCDLIGIDLDAVSICRVNDGMSLAACRLLYAYQSYVLGGRLRSWFCHQALLKSLAKLSGPSLRLHPQMLQPIRSRLDAQLPLLQERYGIDLSENWEQLDGELIRTRADLFDFSQASLNWLAAATGQAPVALADPEARARQVAAQMVLLGRRVCSRRARIKQQLHQQLTQIRSRFCA